MARYEVRKDVGGWFGFDTERQVVCMGSWNRHEAVVERTVALLNREYQRWVADRFYDEQSKLAEASGEV